MDWRSIESKLLLQVSDDNRKLEDARRVRTVLRHVRRHIRKIEKRHRMINSPIGMPVTDTQQWLMMRNALATDSKIIAFDAEWQYQWPHHITEIGVAIYHHGRREVHNIRVKGGVGKADSSTRFMSDMQAKRWLTETFKDAGLLIGHAISNDRMKMKQWGWILPLPDRLPCVDTEKWSRVLNVEKNNSQKLTTFCANHGVEILRAHVAGNDACMTLDVALRLAAMEKGLPMTSEPVSEAKR